MTTYSTSMLKKDGKQASKHLYWVNPQYSILYPNLKLQEMYQMLLKKVVQKLFFYPKTRILWQLHLFILPKNLSAGIERAGHF